MDINCESRRCVVDGWEKIKKLGQGQFGCVTLWRNIVTREEIVIKQCIVELSPKNKVRWKDEIGVLRNSKHRNLVSAREVPLALAELLNSSVPCLGLEHCEGGDLRKILSYPENCVGLKERTVLDILNDVSQGITFLHQHKVVHRDIKPENILISYMGTKTIYKITDLGYAKQLDQTSLCTSFVGTLHYIAPELYAGKQSGYNTMADFWSFGTMIFECITGMRPFEICAPAVQWYQIISSKGKNDIWAQVVNFASKEVSFYSTIPEPHRLSRPMVEHFETWLQLVLRWDPHERGGTKNEHGVRECTQLIPVIFQKKVIKIFSMSNGNLTEYEIKGNEKVSQLYSYIEKNLDIHPSSQELLLATGSSLNPEESILTHYKEMENTEKLLFLLDKGFIAPTVPVIVPNSVQDVVGSPEVLRKHNDLTKLWGHTLHFCRETAENYRRMLQGQRALLIKLVNCNSVLTSCKEALSANEQIFMANKSILERSCEFDLTKYYENGLEKRSTSRWVKEDIEKLLGKVRRYELECQINFKEKVRAEQERLVAIRKNPLCCQNDSELDKITNEVRSLLEHHRRVSKDQKSTLGNGEMIAKKVLDLIQKYEMLYKAFLPHLRNIVTCKSGMEDLARKMQGRISDIRQAQKQIQEWMQQKQELIWNFAIQPVQLEFHHNRQDSLPDIGSLASTLSMIIDRRKHDASLPEFLNVIAQFEHRHDRLRHKMARINLEIPDNEKVDTVKSTQGIHSSLNPITSHTAQPVTRQRAQDVYLSNSSTSSHE